MAEDNKEDIIADAGNLVFTPTLRTLPCFVPWIHGNFYDTTQIYVDFRYFKNKDPSFLRFRLASLMPKFGGHFKHSPKRVLAFRDWLQSMDWYLSCRDIYTTTEMHSSIVVQGQCHAWAHSRITQYFDIERRKDYACTGVQHEIMCSLNPATVHSTVGMCNSCRLVPCDNCKPWKFTTVPWNDVVV